MSPITVDLSLRFHVSITQIAQLSSYMLLILGFWAYVNSSLCRLCGKRGVFVISVLIMTVADIWAATSSSYGSLMGARCLSGFGQAAFEPLTLSLIPDLYFVHERGKRVAVFLLALQTGVYLGVPIATQIIVRTSYEYGFGILGKSCPRPPFPPPPPPRHHPSRIRLPLLLLRSSFRQCMTNDRTSSRRGYHDHCGIFLLSRNGLSDTP